MPDIALCKAKECAVRNICYRYRAVPDKDWQSYFSPTSPGDEGCQYYSKIMDGDKLQPVEADDGNVE